MCPPDDAGKDLALEGHGKYFEARFSGTFSVDLFNRFVDASVQACRERKFSHLLLDLMEIEEPITISERFDIASYGAAAAAKLKVVVLASRELIDPEKFGVMVAQNRGLKVDIFPERAKAIAWLLARNESSLR